MASGPPEKKSLPSAINAWPLQVRDLSSRVWPTRSSTGRSDGGLARGWISTEDGGVAPAGVGCIRNMNSRSDAGAAMLLVGFSKKLYSFTKNRLPFGSRPTWIGVTSNPEGWRHWTSGPYESWTLFWARACVAGRE